MTGWSVLAEVKVEAERLSDFRHACGFTCTELRTDENMLRDYVHPSPKKHPRGLSRGMSPSKYIYLYPCPVTN
jgi:hypothetical protein